MAKKRRENIATLIPKIVIMDTGVLNLRIANLDLTDIVILRKIASGPKIMVAVMNETTTKEIANIVMNHARISMTSEELEKAWR